MPYYDLASELILIYSTTTRTTTKKWKEEIVTKKNCKIKCAKKGRNLKYLTKIKFCSYFKMRCKKYARAVQSQFNMIRHFLFSFYLNE